MSSVRYHAALHLSSDSPSRVQVLSEVILALYLTTASFKALALSFPVDITLFLGALTIVLGLARVYARGGVKIFPSVVAVGFFCFAAIPIIQHGWVSAYGMGKIFDFYTVVLIGVFGSLFIAEDEDSVSRIICYIAIPGAVVSVYGLLSFDVASVERLGIGGVSSIALGRGIGMSVLIGILYFLYHKGVWGRVVLFLSMICIAALFFVGNRQGVLASGLSLIGALGIASVGSARKNGVQLKIVLVLASLLGAIYFVLSMVPKYSLFRFMSILDFASDRSSSIRLVAIREAFGKGLDQLMGYGWGAFYDLEILSYTGQNIAYPHNIFAEVFYELGIFPLLYLFFWIFWCAMRSVRIVLKKPGFTQVSLLSILIYNIVVSSISGEASSEKLFWATLILCSIIPVNKFPKTRRSVLREINPRMS